VFAAGEPDDRGGGTVEIVTLDDVVWAGPPDKDEAGSPNTVGAIALAAAIRQLEAIGMDAVAQHEAELTAYALERLPGVPGIRIFGATNPATSADRLGVIPIKLANASHFLAAAVLGHEFGIGVRSGCFCAHPYILKLLGLSEAEANQVRETMLAGNRADMPGLLRASFGLYNTTDDVDALVAALQRIATGDYRGQYDQDVASGEFKPRGWQPDFEAYFAL
jgi:selenocysteine lyase/cysteine desulfurase